jgi:hypothetical protein
MNLDPNTIKSDDEEDIFDVIGAGDLPEDEKSALLVKMMNLVQARSLEKVMDLLDEAAKKELEEKVLLDDPEESMEEFLQKYVPNFGEIFEDEAKKLRMEMIKETF